MIIKSQEQVTDAVLQAMAGTTDPRLGEIMAALVRHLHAFAREVRLTEHEWEQAVGHVVRMGQLTNDHHNEVVLASDAIGLSTLVCLLNNGAGGNTETAAALLGPFWRMHSPVTANGGSIVRSATPGPELIADLVVRDGAGRPIGGVEVDVWHSSPVGMYENQDDSQADMNLRGKFTTDADGRFSFRSVRPAGYPVPVNGVIGQLLAAQNRHPFRPAHVHFLLFKPGFKTLVTQVFVDNDPYLESDVVFGVTRSLIGDFKADGDRFRLNYCFVMEPGEAVLPIPPIK